MKPRRCRAPHAYRPPLAVLALVLVAFAAACEVSSTEAAGEARAAGAPPPTAAAASPTRAAEPEPTPTATTAPPHVPYRPDGSPVGSPTRSVAGSASSSPPWIAAPCRPDIYDYWMLWRNFLQWHPDGSELLVTHGPRLYAVAADGSDARTVARGETPQGYGSMISFDLSPDGRQLVFAGCDYARPDVQLRGEPDDYLGYQYELARLGPKIGEPVRLTSNHEFDGFPAWSPDGQRIAFLTVLLTDQLLGARYVGARWLSVMAADGTGLRIVVRVEAPARARYRGLALVAPAWSPDGRRLAFAAADADGRVGIYVVRVDGANKLRLRDLQPLVTDAVSGPAWSPDGRRLVYARLVDDLLGLYTVRVDGADEAEVVTIDWLLNDARHLIPPAQEFGLVRNLAWSPDGARLLYSYGAATCVVSADGELLGRTQVMPHAPSFGRWDCVLTATDESEQRWPPWVTDYPPGWYMRSKEADTSAVWSPDGQRIAFFRSEGHIDIRSWGDTADEYPAGTTVYLFTMAPDGSDARELARIGSKGPVLPEQPPGDDRSDR